MSWKIIEKYRRILADETGATPKNWVGGTGVRLAFWTFIDIFDPGENLRVRFDFLPFTPEYTNHVMAASPLRSRIFKSFSDGPPGCFSPISHLTVRSCYKPEGVIPITIFNYTPNKFNLTDWFFRFDLILLQQGSYSSKNHL